MFTEFKHLFRDSKFTYLWISQILSQLTINIMNFTLVIKLFNVTGSTIATSFLWVSYALPAILVGPLAAVFADMVDRRKTLIVSNFAQAVTIFFYAIFHSSRFFLLYGVAMAYSLFNQFYVPAEAASLPSLVTRKHLAYANSLFFLTQQGSLIAGVGIASILNKFLGFKNTLLFCSLLIFLAFVSVYFLPALKTKDILHAKNIEGKLANFFKRILEGYRFIKENNSIRTPFILLMVIQIALAILAVNVPALANEILRIKVESAGILIAVPGGVGALIGVIYVSKLVNSAWRKKKIIEIFMTILFISILFLLVVVPITQSYGRILLGALSIMMIGFSFVGIIIPSQTYLQEATPGGLRGRVFGNFWFLVTIATIFPVIFSGTITELFGIRLLLLIIEGLIFGSLILSKKFGEKFLKN